MVTSVDHFNIFLHEKKKENKFTKKKKINIVDMENAHQTYIVHRYSPILPCYVVYVISLLLFCCNITIICLNFVFFSFTCPVVLFPFLLTSNLWMPFSSPIFRIHTHTHTKGRGIFFLFLSGWLIIPSLILTMSLQILNHVIYNYFSIFFPL